MNLNSYIFIELTQTRTPLSQCAYNLDRSKVIKIRKDQLSDNSSVLGGICSCNINGLNYFLFLNPNKGPLNGYLLPVLRYGRIEDIPATVANIEWANADGTYLPCDAEGVIVAEPINGYPGVNGSLAQYFKPLQQDQDGNWEGITYDLKDAGLQTAYTGDIVGILDSDLVSINAMQNVYPVIYKAQYQTQQAVSLITTIFNFVMSMFKKNSK